MKLPIGVCAVFKQVLCILHFCLADTHLSDTRRHLVSVLPFFSEHGLLLFGQSVVLSVLTLSLINF